MMRNPKPQVAAAAIVAVLLVGALALRELPTAEPARPQAAPKPGDFRLLAQRSIDRAKDRAAEPLKDHPELVAAYYLALPLQMAAASAPPMASGPTPGMGPHAMPMYRIVGDGGRTIMANPIPTGDNEHVWVTVMRGYGVAPKHPALEVIRGHEVLFRKEIAELPAPKRVLSPDPEPSPEVKARISSWRGMWGEPMLEVILAKPSTTGGFAQVQVRRTSFADYVKMGPYYPTGMTRDRGPAVVAIPHINDVREVEIEVERSERRDWSHRFDVVGVELAEQNGMPVLRVAKDITLPVKGGGLFVIPTRQPGINRVPKHRHRRASLVVEYRQSGRALRPGESRSQTEVWIVDAPLAERGLESILRNGAPISATVKPQGPIRPGPLPLRVEFRIVRWVPSGRRIYTIPVEPATTTRDQKT